MITAQMLHYFSIGVTIAFGSIGAGIGQGIGSFNAIGAMSRQPLGNDKTFRAMVIGLAFIESGVILALVMALITLFTTTIKITWAIAWAELGIALGIGIAATAVSVASSFAVKSATISISRQPFFAQKVMTIMLLSQSIIEAPVVFTFIICLLIRARFVEALTLFDGIKFLAAALCIGVGCVGPSVGQSIFAHASCKAIGLNKNIYRQLFTFSMVNQAIIETPLIFCLLSAILIIFNPLSASNPFGALVGFCAAAFCIAVGSFGTATGSGMVGSKSCEQMAIEPESYAVLFRSTILAQSFIQSAVIYALIVTLYLITRSY